MSVRALWNPFPKYWLSLSSLWNLIAHVMVEKQWWLPNAQFCCSFWDSGDVFPLVASGPPYSSLDPVMPFSDAMGARAPLDAGTSFANQLAISILFPLLPLDVHRHQLIRQYFPFSGVPMQVASFGTRIVLIICPWRNKVLLWDSRLSRNCWPLGRYYARPQMGKPPAR